MTIQSAYLKSLAFPIGVYLVIGVLLFGTTLFSRNIFFEAVSIDLIISAPIFYLIAARKFKTRMLLVFPLIGFGLALAKWWLPNETVTMHWLSKLLLPVIELVTIGSIS